MRRLALPAAVLVALATLAALAAWLVGDAPPVATPGLAFAEEAEDARDAAALRGVDAQANAAAPARAELEAEAAAPDPEAEAIELLFVDEHSRDPVPGVGVTLRSRGGEAQGRADERGQLRIVPPAGGRPWWLRARAEGYAPVHDRRLAGDETVELVPVVALTGRVLDALSGLGIAGASLSVSGSRDWSGSSAVAAPDGSYALPAVPTGVAVHVTVEAAGYGAHRTAFQVPPGRAPPARDFHLPRARAVDVRVLDFATGAPLEGANVLAGTGAAVTDARGRARVEVVPEPGVEATGVRVVAADYSPALGRFPVDGEIEVRLPRSVSIVGTVTDAAGQPVAGARVAAVRERDPNTGKHPETAVDPVADANPGWSILPGDAASFTTDRDGSFRLYSLRAYTAGMVLAVSGADGHRDAEVRLEPLPAPGVRLRLDVALDRTGDQGPTGVVTGRIEHTGSSALVSFRCGERRGQVTARDEYRIEGLAGEVELTVWPMGGQRPAGSTPSSRARVFVPDGEVVEHDFDLASDLAEIRGRVVTTAGAPASDARIMAMQGDPRTLVAYASSDDAGAFALDVPRAGGPCDLMALSPGGLGDGPSTATAHPGDVDVVLVVLATGQLRFRALDRATGEPLARVALLARREGETRFQVCRQLDGVPDVQGWSAYAVPTGGVELAVRDARGTYAPVGGLRAVVPEEGAAEVEVRMDRGLVLELRRPDGPADGGSLVLLEPEHAGAVTWNQGRPVARPTLPPTIDLGRRTVDRGDGVARLRGLAPGTYHLLVPEGAPRPEPESIDLRESGQVVELRWGAPEAAEDR